MPVSVFAPVNVMITKGNNEKEVMKGSKWMFDSYVTGSVCSSQADSWLYLFSFEKKKKDCYR